MARWPLDRTAVVGMAVVVFIVCCLLPVAYVPVLTGGRAFSAAMADPRHGRLLLNTLAIGVGAAVLATGIGAPLGVALARGALARPMLLRLVLGAPILIPPYIAGLAWTFLGASSIYSVPGVVGVLGLTLYPISMLATEAAIRRIDGRLEEAALLAAPPSRVLWRVTLPLAAPAVLAAALLVFVLAVSEFGVPALLQVRVYTTEVFTAFAALYDFTGAMVLAAPLLLLCGGVAAVAVALLGDRLVTTRRTSSPQSALLNEWRAPATAGAITVLALALGLPLGLLGVEAWDVRSPAIMMAQSGRATANSLLLAGAGATIVVAVAVWLGYARARVDGRPGRILDLVFLLVFAVPSTIVGVGLIGLWNRPGFLGGFYGTNAMLLLVYLARFVPVAALILSAGARSVPVSHEDAAAIGGAAWWRIMTRIVLPQMRLALGVAWVVVFILAFGELGASILVAPPGDASLPIRVYTLIANAPPSQVALLAVGQIAVMFVPLAALAAVLSRRRQPL